GDPMISFQPTQEQEMIRKTAREFVQKHVNPNVNAWEETGEIPEDVVLEAGKVGLLGAPIPAEYGGTGLDNLTYAMVTEEVGKGCSSLRTTFSVNTSLFGNNVAMFGNEEQKKAYLPAICTGEKRGAWALTEHQSGSDAKGMLTTATPDGSDYVVVFARVGPKGEFDPKKKDENLACFVVHKEDEGFSTGTVMGKGKLGLRASHTAELVFEDCRIPADRLVGEVGQGWEIANAILQKGRLSVAAGAVGIAQAAYEASLDYANEREAFGRSIGNFQLIREHLAYMHQQIETARLLVWKAAWMADEGMDNALAVSTAKLHAAEVVMDVTERAVQIHAGNGYSDEYPVERYFRDAKICGIYEGTNEIHKLIIGSKVLGDA
ncbi:MAG: acyl-CoA dehydrogenase family protein, partial [Candidatus Thermoplasmatota archaeon]|nr:acyl-CoA dehydrogenase family protein [Candidatus Thermoplasmatota archaeon]